MLFKDYEEEIEKLEQRNLEIKSEMGKLSEDSSDFKMLDTELKLNEKTIESYRREL